MYILFFFNSCVTTNRIITIEDSFKEINGIKLLQKPQAVSSEKTGSFGDRKYFDLAVNYLFQKTKTGQSVLIAEFQMQKLMRVDELDSILILDLDHEKVKLISTENKSSPLMNRKFIVPENLWVSIVHSQEIDYRLYAGKQEVDVKLNTSETAKLKEFFQKAIQQREANLSPVPEGQKKW
jgi:hypothetical protein